MMETAIEEQLSEVSGAVRPVSVLLIYPSTSEVALANLGFQRVYTLLNAIDGVTCDRFSLCDSFLPGSLFGFLTGGFLFRCGGERICCV